MAYTDYPPRTGETGAPQEGPDGLGTVEGLIEAVRTRGKRQEGLAHLDRGDPNGLRSSRRADYTDSLDIGHSVLGASTDAEASPNADSVEDSPVLLTASMVETVPRPGMDEMKVEPRSERRHRFRGRIAIAAGMAAVLAAIGGGYIYAKSRGVFGDNAKDKGSSAAGVAPPNREQPTAAPTPEDNEEGIAHPHTPRGVASERGYIDTSVETPEADKGYTLEFGDPIRKVILPKLEAPTNDPESIKKSFNDSLKVADGIFTALINPDPAVSEGKLKEMLRIYAADPDKMYADLMTHQENLRTIANAGKRKDIAIMIYDIKGADSAQVVNQTITDDAGNVYSAMVAVGGTSYIRGEAPDPKDPTNWQWSAGVIPEEGYALKPCVIALNSDGKFRTLTVVLAPLNSIPKP